MRLKEWIDEIIPDVPSEVRCALKNHLVASDFWDDLSQLQDNLELPKGFLTERWPEIISIQGNSADETKKFCKWM